MPRSLALLLGMASLNLFAQSASVQTEHMRADLLVYAPEGLQAGGEFKLGLWLRHEPHWHSYWRNPGDSGLPTNLRWELPSGWTADEIDWPTPKAFLVDPLMNFGYESEVLLPVTIKLPASLGSDPVQLKMRARWLVCEEICVPESGQFVLNLTPAPMSQHKAIFDAADNRRPLELSAPITAVLEADSLRLTADQLPPDWTSKSLQAFPEVAGVFEHALPIEQHWHDGVWSARLALSAQCSASPGAFYLVLTADQSEYAMRVRVLVPAWSKNS